MRSKRLLSITLVVICNAALAACGTAPSSSSPSSSVEGDLPAPSGAVVQEREPAAPSPTPAAPVPVADKTTRVPAAAAAKLAPTKPKSAPAALTDTDNATVSGGDSEPAFDNLDVVDAGLNGKLTVLRVGSEPTETHLLSVFAGLKNKTPRRLRLEIQTIYKDASGNALNGGSWISFNLNPHEEREYHSASISDQASDFLIRVRRATTPP
jgi:hypothetical protein